MASEHNRAIIVAVESYTEETWPTLNGPAADAVRFARWLSGGRVPNEHLHIFASVEDGSQSEQDLNQCVADLGAPQVRPANSDTIGDFINRELADVPAGELLFVYWSGHGLVDRTSDRRLLLFSDATADATKVLEFDAFLDCLNSTRVKPFQHYTLFVDACAKYMRQANELREPLTIGEPRQEAEDFFVYLATGQDEIASYDSEERTGAFSKEIFTWLSNKGNAWLEERDDLIRHIGAHFEKLAKTDAYAQRPVSRWRRHKGHIVAEGEEPVAELLQLAARTNQLSTAQVRLLASGFAALRIVQDDALWRALPLPDALRDAMKEHDVPLGDHEAIVALAIHHNCFVELLKTVERAGQHGDVTELRRVERTWIALSRLKPLVGQLRTAPLPAVREAFRLCADHVDSSPSHNIEDALLEVYRLTPSMTEPDTLHRFLAHLEALGGLEVPDALWGINADAVTRIRADVSQRHILASPHLVMDLSEGTSSGLLWPQQVVSYELNRNGEWDSGEREPCQPTLEGAQAAAVKIIDEYFLDDGGQDAGASIGLIVTPEQMSTVPERWEIDADLDGRVMQRTHVTLLHFAPRRYAGRAKKRWVRRMQSFQANPLVNWIDEQQLEDKTGFYNCLEDQADAFVAMRFVPDLAAEQSALGLRSVLQWGAPLVLWFDRPPGNWGEQCATAETLVSNGAPEEFPVRLFNLRRQPAAAEQFLADNLRVIWDDAGYLPPENVFGMSI